MKDVKDQKKQRFLRTPGRRGAAVNAGAALLAFFMFLVVMVEQWRAGKDHTPALVGLGASLICLVIFGSSNFLIPSMLGITAALTLLRGPMEKRAQKEEAAHVD